MNGDNIDQDRADEGGNQPYAEPVENSVFRQSDWSGKLLLSVSFALVIFAAIAAYGAGWGLWSKSSAISQLQIVFAVAVIIIILAVAFISRAKASSGKGRYTLKLIAILVSALLCGYLASWQFKAIGGEGLHDISTNLADPPSFRAIESVPSKADVPGADEEDYAGLSPQQRWERIHQEAYPDIRTVRVNQPVAKLVDAAENLADARGWKIIEANPSAGRLEARTSWSPLGYEQAIAIRVRPAENGSGSTADMRVVTYGLQDDQGSGAQIITEFLADLPRETEGQ